MVTDIGQMYFTIMTTNHMKNKSITTNFPPCVRHLCYSCVPLGHRRQWNRFLNTDAGCAFFKIEIGYVHINNSVINTSDRVY